MGDGSTSTGAEMLLIKLLQTYREVLLEKHGATIAVGLYKYDSDLESPTAHPKVWYIEVDMEGDNSLR